MSGATPLAQMKFEGELTSGVDLFLGLSAGSSGETCALLILLGGLYLAARRMGDRRDIHGHLDPVFFLGYWRRDDATRAKFTGDPSDSWCRTGDTALRDADGHLWYQGRSDDMFKAAGYRIGPSEVENCLVKHPAVANAAVVPKPDAERAPPPAGAARAAAPCRWSSSAARR